MHKKCAETACQNAGKRFAACWANARPVPAKGTGRAFAQQVERTQGIFARCSFPRISGAKAKAKGKGKGKGKAKAKAKAKKSAKNACQKLAKSMQKACTEARPQRAAQSKNDWSKQAKSEAKWDKSSARNDVMCPQFLAPGTPHECQMLAKCSPCAHIVLASCLRNACLKQTRKPQESKQAGKQASKPESQQAHKKASEQASKQAS